MTWKAGTYYSAVCDRCNTECEDLDMGSTVLFATEDMDHLTEYHQWHEVRREDGSVEHICDECWESIGADDAVIAQAAVEEARYGQTGPDLLGGE